MTTAKIGIIGAGQAGKRIAATLSKFPDVEVAAIVDPTANLDVFISPNSPWRLDNTRFFTDDDAMLTVGDYDALVVAVDPQSVMMGPRPKLSLLHQHAFSKPLLWERPFGFEPDHPQRIVETLSSVPQHSIMSFSRYGVPSRVLAPTILSGDLGEIVDFEIFATLNCNLTQKPWRHDGNVPQPVHFLDSAFEMIDTLSLGSVESLSANRTTVERKGIKFDEKWEISLTLSTGTTGRIVGIQYLGDYESLYPLRQLRVIGTSGALHSALGSTSFFDSTGTETKIAFPPIALVSEIHDVAHDLTKFFRAVEACPQEAACLGEALALVECLRAWVDGLSGTASGNLLAPASPAECASYLRIARAAILSAASATRIAKKDWEEL